MKKNRDFVVLDMIVMTMMMLARTEYMRWKYRNNKEDKISVDESGMTQFDPLLKWEVMINDDQYGDERLISTIVKGPQSSVENATARLPWGKPPSHSDLRQQVEAPSLLVAMLHLSTCRDVLLPCLGHSPVLLPELDQVQLDRIRQLDKLPFQ